MDTVASLPTRAERQVRLMGTTAHVVLVGDASPPVSEVVGQLEHLEAAWSRFRQDSELSRLNRGASHPTLVSHPTALLLERSVWAWEQTAGLFDPTVLPSLLAAGYDRDFEDLASAAPVPGSTEPAPGCGGVEVDPRNDLVRLPAGVMVDPGGIGKGLAADLAATAAVDRGADAALVSVGGDLRVAGRAPTEGWEIELDHHVTAPARVNLVDGAVATSTTLRRRWATADGTAHHVIDPRTGRPSNGDLVACSVVAAEAWWAEALATALLVGWGDPARDPSLADLLVDLLGGAGALLTHADGRQRAVGPLADAFSPGRSQ